MTKREAFERWIKESGSFTDWSRSGGPHTDGDYLKPLVQRTWLAWCAAVEWSRVAGEEASKEG